MGCNPISTPQYLIFLVVLAQPFGNLNVGVTSYGAILFAVVTVVAAAVMDDRVVGGRCGCSGRRLLDTVGNS